MCEVGLRSLLLLILLASACVDTTRQAPGEAPGDSAFKGLAGEVLQDYYRRHPSAATVLGVHTYDDRLEDFSAAGVNAEVAADSAFRARLVAADTTTLSLVEQLDRQQLIHTMAATIVADRMIQPWAKNADTYSGGVTNAAYVIMERAYAPAEQRLASLIAREKAMPAALAEARKNLANPPKIFTQIAIEQLDGNISFFKNDLPAAFSSVTDPKLLADFKASNVAVMKALSDYKTLLQQKLLPASNGDYALGADTYAKDLEANEMIDVPLPRLLAVAEADRQKNEAAFEAAAKAHRSEQAGGCRARVAAGGSSTAGPAARGDPGNARFAAAVRRRPSHPHDSARRAGAREGDAALHALDDHRVHGHTRAV